MSVRARRIKVGLLLGGVVALVTAGAVGALIRPAQEPDQVLHARMGDVVWNHELHARMEAISNCQVCHHKERPGTMKPRPCRQCHELQSNQAALIVADLHIAEPPAEDTKGATEAAPQPATEGEEGEEHGPPPMEAFHGRCVGCHRVMKQGPVVCRDCHAQTFSGLHGIVRWNHLAHARRIDMDPSTPGLADNCKICHHQDESAEWDDGYRPCGACHQPAAEKDLPTPTGIERHEELKHGDCDRCHTLFNPEEGAQTCKDCHKGWDIDTEGADRDPRRRPALEQAIHMRCLECHQRDNPDRTEAMPFRCQDCHRPDPSIITQLEAGLVMWDHRRHSEYGEDMACDTCHHTDEVEQPHMACSRCHGTGLYDNPSVAEALEKRCLGCHEERENGLIQWDRIATEKKNLGRFRYEGPKGAFWWDHRAHAIGWSFSCRNCHHGILRDEQGRYVTAKKAKQAWTGEATKVQSCRVCHGETGPVKGSPAEGSEAPKLDDLFQKICVECHQRLGAKPGTWAAFFEIEPLERPAPRAGGGE